MEPVIDIGFIIGFNHFGFITGLEIYQNDKLICDSKANYAMTKSSHMSGGHDTTAARHIASMSGCRSNATVTAGDKFQIVVNYDMETNPG